VSKRKKPNLQARHKQIARQQRRKPAPIKAESLPVVESVGPLSGIKHVKHCDDYIDDPNEDPVLRKFLDWARKPGHGMLEPKPHPKLFATHQGKRVRVTMASRFGDVGITRDMQADCGYETRARVSALTDFSEDS
jgi:hypothetical protein